MPGRPAWSRWSVSAASGHLGVKYARIAGAEVVAVDVSDERLKTAEDLGADHLVHAGEQDVAAERSSGWAGRTR